MISSGMEVRTKAGYWNLGEEQEEKKN